MTRRAVVVMAGGSGERFWPLSRISRPKQFLRLAGGSHSLLRQALDNIAPMFPPENIFIATGEGLVSATRREAPFIPSENILAEPFKRNTAGCLAFAAAQILARYGDGPDVVMAALAADHAVSDPERYRRALDAALAIAEFTGDIVTLGIDPIRPETGYGYIEAKQTALSIPGVSKEFSVFPVERFHEKPDQRTAETYLESGRFFWNSGMFFWLISAFMRELKSTDPDMARAVDEIAGALSTGDQNAVRVIFRKLPNISIDYALMEKTRRALVVKTDFGWDDVGTWDALDRTMPRDILGNVTVGGPAIIDSSDCIVYNEPGAEKCAVAVLGVEGLAVIVSRDGVLVMPKSRAQDVRKVVAELKRRNAKQV